MKVLPEPFIQVCNIRLPSPTRQGSSLAHSVKEQQQLRIQHRLYIHNKSQLIPCFLNCTKHYLITFDKLLKANLLRRGNKREGCKWVQANVITQKAICLTEDRKLQSEKQHGLEDMLNSAWVFTRV